MPKIDPKSRWVGPLLSASIILNVFLIGFLAARISSPDNYSAEFPPVQMSFRSLPDNVPSAVRERLEAQLRDEKEELQDAYDDLRRAQLRAYDLMAQDKVDQAALEEAFDEIRILSIQIQGPVQRAIVDAVSHLSADTRRALIGSELAISRNQFSGPDRVDGSRWKFDFDGTQFSLKLDGLNGLENIEDMEFYFQAEDWEDAFADGLMNEEEWETTFEEKFGDRSNYRFERGSSDDDEESYEYSCSYDDEGNPDEDNDEECDAK